MLLYSVVWWYDSDLAKGKGRMKIDSRGFNANYLYMDGIREPLHLSDLKSNSLRLK